MDQDFSEQKFKEAMMTDSEDAVSFDDEQRKEREAEMYKTKLMELEEKAAKWSAAQSPKSPGIMNQKSIYEAEKFFSGSGDVMVHNDDLRRRYEANSISVPMLTKDDRSVMHRIECLEGHAAHIEKLVNAVSEELSRRLERLEKALGL